MYVFRMLDHLFSNLILKCICVCFHIKVEERKFITFCTAIMIAHRSEYSEEHESICDKE